MSYFTTEALKKFQEMCAAGLEFAEGEEYDFAQCLMSNGDIYGVEPGEACERGRPISDSQAKVLRNKKKQDKDPAAHMAILKKAFLKKNGREMTKEELAKAAWLVNKKK